MSQSDGEPAWQAETYNASKDKKHLTGINKEEVLGKGMRITPTKGEVWLLKVLKIFN